MNVNALDLNLLRVFDAVMAEGNVTRAAERLFLSQPATSHALGRLRHQLGDELFVKVPGGVRPTPRAVELADPVRTALLLLQDAFSPDDFDPKTSHRVIRVATHDYLTTTLMDAVAAHLAVHAPLLSVRLSPTAGRALERLDRQEADMAISAFGEVPERFEKRQLFRDRCVLLMRKGHPLASGRMTLRRYANARHLLISPRGDERGFADEALAAQGMTRHIAMIINQFAPAAGIVACSDLLLTVPERLARSAVALHDLQMRDAPIEPPGSFTSTDIVWHARLGKHPALEWFRDTLCEIAMRSEDAA